MNHVIVAKPHTAKLYIMRALMAVTFVASGWGLYELGYFQSGRDVQEAIDNYQQVVDQLVPLKEENEVLNVENLRLERTIEVESIAYAQVRQSLVDMQNEILELKQQVSFYKGIVSPRAGKAGLQVLSVEVLPQVDKDGFEYRIGMAQSDKKRKLVRGKLELVINGLLDGKAKRIRMDSVQQAKAQYKYRFKYYQVLKGKFSLPQGFTPLTLEVAIIPSGQSTPLEVFNYQWHEGGSLKHVGKQAAQDD